MTPNVHHAKCTRDDYRRLFAASAEPLRWLCCTLTGNEQLSDKILSAALEQSLRGSDHVFQGWIISWSRRSVIQACIEIMQPSPSTDYPLHALRIRPAKNPSSLADIPDDLLQQELLRFDVLSRFVFVLRTVEGYSRRETSLLLNIDDRTCEWLHAGVVDALEAAVDLSATHYNIATVNGTAHSLAQAAD